VFAKIVASIVVIGGCACGVLAIRQMRTQAAHELAETRLRIMQRDNELWRLRTRIAQNVTPKRVHDMAARLSGLQTLTPELASGRQAMLAPAAPSSSDLAAAPSRREQP
jgi:hypothetical protein